MKKKLLYIALALLLLICLTACGAQEEQEAAVQETALFIAAAEEELTRLQAEADGLAAEYDELLDQLAALTVEDAPETPKRGIVSALEPIACEDCGSYGYGIVTTETLYSECEGAPSTDWEYVGCLAVIEEHKVIPYDKDLHGWLRIRLLGQRFEEEQAEWWIRDGDIIPYAEVTEYVLTYPVQMSGQALVLYSNEIQDFPAGLDYRIRFDGSTYDHPEDENILVYRPDEFGGSASVYQRDILYPDMEIYGHYHVDRHYEGRN